MIDLLIIPGEVAPSLLSATSASVRPPPSLQGRGTSARPWINCRSADDMSDMATGVGVVVGERGGLSQVGMPAAAVSSEDAGRAVVRAMQQLAALGEEIARPAVGGCSVLGGGVLLQLAAGRVILDHDRSWWRADAQPGRPAWPTCA